MELGKYSFGTGDRFARQGEAQLNAFIEADKKGLEITPVWNKSNREHLITGSDPADTRIAADNAVKNLQWSKPWFVDADHINMENVDKFIDSSDFFTIDVADYIGISPLGADLDMFVRNNLGFIGELNIPGIHEPFIITSDLLQEIGKKFLYAVKQAAEIYRQIESKKGKGNFITEISMDEVDKPQSPVELFFILSAIASEIIPVQTIAPKFTGRFNKGVEYQGDLALFAREFEQDLMVIDMAVKVFGLTESLKLSVHSGSDKFSIYPVIGNLIRKHNKGIHIKTAGTSWLEEMTGLAMAGGEALDLAVKIYNEALVRFNELCGPYSAVIDIKRENLPSAREVSEWDGNRFASALRHEPDHPHYNPDMRQLVHVAYKIAAEHGETYTAMLEKHREIIGLQVTSNIYNRHFERIFDL
jgi:tagaturonate epimerase